MASVKRGAITKDALYNFDSILVSLLVSPLVSKRKRSEV